MGHRCLLLSCSFSLSFARRIVFCISMIWTWCSLGQIGQARQSPKNDCIIDLMT